MDSPDTFVKKDAMKDRTNIIRKFRCFRTQVMLIAAVASALGSVQLFATGNQTPAEIDSFCHAILTRETIKLKGDVVIDSFDSSRSDLSTNQQYDPTKRRARGNLGSFGDTELAIKDGDAGSVYGRVTTSSNGDLELNGGAAVGSESWIDDGNTGVEPGYYSDDLDVDIPDPSVPFLDFDGWQSNSGTVGGTNYNYVFTTGNYWRWSDFTLSGSKSMVIDGDVVIYFKSEFDIKDSAFVYLTPGSTLTVYLRDSADLGGKGIVNGTGLASECQLVGLSNCTRIEYTGSAGYIGTIYAPKAEVKLSGDGDFVGALVAKRATLTGTYAFHYDESLCDSDDIDPVANDDYFSTFAEEPLVIDAPGLLANDVVFGEPDLNIELIDLPANGVLNLVDDGSFTYEPGIGFAGIDEFTYRVNEDGKTSNIATVRVEVIEPFELCASTAVIDHQYGSGNADHAVYLPGIANDFVFVPAPGSFKQTGPDTASLSGLARSVSSPDKAFLVDVELGGYSETPPSGSPKRELSNAAYVDNGGPIDPSTWVYYQTIEGTLVGVDALEGALLEITRIGPSFQIGLGASGKNLNFGASSWFDWDVLSQPNSGSIPHSGTGDFNIDLGNCIDAQDDSYTTIEEVELIVDAPGVLANDSSNGSEPLRAFLINPPANGSVTLDENGSFEYTPAVGFLGTDQFVYVANDGTLDSNLATVTVDVRPLEDEPDDFVTANDDNYSTPEDTELVLTAPGVLLNDDSSSGDPLSAILDTPTQNGTLTLNADGSFSYLPNQNFNGIDTFKYLASDGAVDSNLGLVTITVTPMNDDAPIAVDDDNYSTPEDTELLITAPGVLANDSDPDGDTLTAIIVTSTQNGTLTLNADGSFSYLPNQDFNGTDTFAYRASDGALQSAPATATIIVTPMDDDAPIAVDDDGYTTPEDTELLIAAPGVLANDSDPDGDPLTAVVETTTQNGTLVLNSDGSFSYLPNQDFNGTDSFTYRASDGVLESEIATATINVTPMDDDAPIAVDDDGYTTPEDTELLIAAPGVLANDSDPDGDPLTAIIETTTQNGTLSLNSDGSFSYLPNLDFNGTDTYTYRASDGALQSAPATVTIIVTPVDDDAPIAADDDGYSTPEDTELLIAAPGVLANDSDPDGDPLTAIIETTTQNGTMVLNADGSFNYLPNQDFNGTDTFTYRASDGTLESSPATATIIVTPMDDDAPVAADDDGYTTPEDTELLIAAPGVLANDTDPDGDLLTAIIETTTANGSLALTADGSFSYLPNQDFNGTDTFTYRASDGALQSAPALVTILVTPVDDDAPIAVDDDNYTTPEDTELIIAAPGVLANDSDPDGDPLTAVIETMTQNGTLVLNPDGSFSYLPNQDFNGTDTFTYRASDGALQSAPATATIIVTPMDDDAPIAVDDDNYTTPEDTELLISAPGVLANDSDPDDDPLTAIIETTTQNGSLSLAPDGSFSYLPNQDFNGTDTFTYRASDGGLQSAPATAKIVVTPVHDDAPIAADDDGYTTPEDTELVIVAPGVLANDTDPDGDPLTAIIETTTQNGSLTLNADGSFSYLPNQDFNGTDTFTYRASDGALQSDPALVTILVTPVVDGLNPQPDAYQTEEDVDLVVDAPGVLANDAPADELNFTASLETLPSNGTVTFFTSGRFVYSPNADFNGVDTFTYRAIDGATASDPVLVKITVTPVPDLPRAVDDRYQTPLDTPLQIDAPGVLANDSDPDGDVLNAVLENDVQNGTLALNADGSFDYTPNSGFDGVDEFTYVANDGTADSNPATVTIVVGNGGVDPMSLADDFSTDEDAVLTVPQPGVLENDTGLFTANVLAEIVTEPTHGTVSLSANGSFVYVPNPDYFGDDEFTYRVSDGNVSIGPVPVTLTVRSVNDPPSFVAGGNFLVQQDSGVREVPNWASQISSGPANEADQQVGFVVSVGNGGILGLLPTADVAGKLRFAPAAGVFGTTTVTVFALDTGGTDRGGIDVSPPVQFEIRINGRPTADVVSPAAGTTYFPHQPFPFDAAVADPDGTVTSSALLIDGQPIENFGEGEAPSTSVTDLAVGVREFSATADDNDGATGTSAPVSINVIPGPPVEPLGQGFNFQVGLVEQIVRIDNPTPYPIPAARVLVTDLPPNVVVFNKSGTTPDGSAFVQYNEEIPAGGSGIVTIEYFTPFVQNIDTTLTGEVAVLQPPYPQQEGELVMITRMSCFPDGRTLLTFESIVGRVYSIEYSNDLENWKTAFPPITAPGDGIQWTDNGWPKTEGHPADEDERFYRVRLLPEQQDE